MISCKAQPSFPAKNKDIQLNKSRLCLCPRLQFPLIKLVVKGHLTPFCACAAILIRLRRIAFSAKSVGQRTTDIRTLGKVLQVTKMLVLDEKRGLQMSIFGPRNTI